MNNQWRDNANKMVIWGDGTYDTARSCSECGSATCKTPVHPDKYKEIGQTVMDAKEAEASLGYWDHMHLYQPLGGGRDHDGETLVNESVFANPDSLPEGGPRQSGVSEDYHAIAQAAFSTLTSKQKEVWQLIMRDQISQTEAARRLNVLQSTVARHLTSAKLKYTNYLRSAQDHVGS